MIRLTGWFPMTEKPRRPGEYEGRERNTRQRVAVYWRKLEDTNHFGWYVYKGVFGPFNLWEDASEKITAWRGLAQPWNGDRR